MPSSSSTTRPASTGAVPLLTDPVSKLRGIGTHGAGKLERLGIRRVMDLLFHLPYRYSDRTRITPIGALRPGRDALVEGTVEITQVRFGRRRNLLSIMSDGTGQLTLRFFHFNQNQQAGLVRGVRLRCYGTVRPGPRGLEMVHPEYQRVGENTPLDSTLTPIYPATEGVGQTTLRRLGALALQALQKQPADLPELLPATLLRQHDFPDLAGALQTVHQPPVDADVDALVEGRHPAQQRLAFEELLALHLGQRRRRSRLQQKPAPGFEPRTDLADRFLARLPFQPTAAQQRVSAEIARDLASGKPMLRLLQGDVGAGKTLVAASAALLAVDNGWQAAIMAPTELLAEQHYRNFHDWLAALKLEPCLLTGKLRSRERGERLAAIRDGTASIVIGTHALFQDKIEFARLGLVIIDEQHRFGVHQRLALLEKGNAGDLSPHQLIMTATPIPRTLAMALHADLDVSIIDELPPGRQPVHTVVLADSRRPQLIERIAGACREQRQVYWVCPLIDESEQLQYQAATETRDQLTAQLPGVRIGLLHGRLRPGDKTAVMQSFQAGELDLLVATTVIEVGVDVPNASLMIIENAERMGLAQMHQLRGRVGRGNQRSDCVLLYKPPLGPLARARLETMRTTNDGFEIARRDLELRGPGELLGTRQTGLPELRIADFSRDRELIPLLPDAAECLLQEAPQQVDPLISRWQGATMDYDHV